MLAHHGFGPCFHKVPSTAWDSERLVSFVAHTAKRFQSAKGMRKTLVPSPDEQGKYVGPSERRRSARVMIQIPVQALFRNSEGVEVRVDAFTLGVSAHGCLLTMDIKPEDGQRMHLRNGKSGVEQTGKVVRAQRARDGSFAVAVDFDAPSPDLWSMVTPPEDWLASKR